MNTFMPTTGSTERFVRRFRFLTGSNWIMSLAFSVSLVFFLEGMAEASQEYQPGAVAVSTELPGWESWRLIDGNPDSVWSSKYHSGSHVEPNEWFAAWWGGPVPVNYIRLVPRTIAGTAFCVPQRIHISVSTPSGWQNIGTVNLPADLPPEGYRVYFPGTVTTDGVLVETDYLRPDDFGNYFFQMADVYGGFDDAFVPPDLEGPFIQMEPPTLLLAPLGGHRFSGCSINDRDYVRSARALFCAVRSI